MLELFRQEKLSEAGGIEVNISELLSYSPYELNHEHKQRVILERLNELTCLHYDNCSEYRSFLDKLHDGKRMYVHRAVASAFIVFFTTVSLMFTSI